MISFPNAKINIGINITEKRPDGFHNIETIFYPINLFDILEVKAPENNFSFTSSGIPIEDEKHENNICIKAYNLLKKNYFIPPIHMHLHKNIPIGAGLGGGSSDAASTLKMLNSMIKLEISDTKLMKIAENTGSDCPFFILNKPSYATNKGDVLTPANIDLKGYFLVLVYPLIHVNTAAAYKKIKPQRSSIKLTEQIKLPVETWKGKIINDFEKIIFEEYPEIQEIKEQLYISGAVYASMSGSGSAVYGLFKNEINLKSIFSKYFIWSEWL